MTARKAPFLEGLRTVDLTGYEILTAFGHVTERDAASPRHPLHALPTAPKGGYPGRDDLELREPNGKENAAAVPTTPRPRRRRRADYGGRMLAFGMAHALER